MPQSNVCADTGNLATITFASGITSPLKVRMIDPSEESLGKINCSDLATTVHNKYTPEDLSDPPELSIEWLWDTFQEPPVPGTKLGLTTVTYPTRVGETTPATRAGTAYVSAVKHPTLKNNELQLGTAKIQFDAVTPLTYTKST